MDFDCDRCGRSYYVPDDLVQGRAAFRAKCTECHHAFEVRPRAPPPPAAVAPEGPAHARAQGAARGSRPVAAARAPGPAARPTATRRPAEARGESSGEQAILAYEREARAQRRRSALLVGAGALAALGAAAALLHLAAVRREGLSPGARPAGSGAPQGPAGAPYADASGLLARREASAPAAAPRPVEVVRKKRSRLARDDRKLLDLLARKQDVTVVAPEGEAVDSARSSLDGVAVERTASANRAAFDACVSKALRVHPNLRVARRATLVLTVQPSGSVTGAFVAEEEVDRTDLGACLSAAARRMIFPAFEGEPVDVSMPLSLSAVF